MVIQLSVSPSQVCIFYFTKKFNNSVKPLDSLAASRKTSYVNGAGPGVGAADRKESVINADFQFSMLKASLDYDTEIFGSQVSQHVIENNPLSRNISTLRSVEASSGNCVSPSL